jgi:hypothetical protein
MPNLKSLETVIKAMNDYGYYAQKALEDQGNPVQMRKKYDTPALLKDTDVHVTVEGYAKDVSGLASNLNPKKTPFTLALHSETILEFSVGSDEQIRSFEAKIVSSNKSKVDMTTKKLSNYYWTMTMTGISVPELQDIYEIELTVNGIKSTMKISPFSYVYAKTSTDGTYSSPHEEDTSKMVLALYNFYLEAKKAFPNLWR